MRKLEFCYIIKTVVKTKNNKCFDKKVSKRIKIMLDKLKAILKDQLDIDTSNITAATRLVEDLKADSIDLMQMVMTVEIDFDVIFEDDDIKKLKTVGDVMKFLEKNKS